MLDAYLEASTSVCDAGKAFKGRQKSVPTREKKLASKTHLTYTSSHEQHGLLY